MNACIRAVVRCALDRKYEVYGVRRGFVGLMEDDIIEMPYKSVSNIVHTGGTILRSGRDPRFKDPAVMREAVNNLLNKGINNLIVIGGDGSFRAVKDIHEGTACNVIGIPATIDNDMGYTDSTIGFDTACNTVLDAILKLRDTITAHDRVMILEVMGRYCGDIALYTGIAGGAEYVILPEVPVDVDAIVESVNEGFRVKEKTSTIIILAEGRKDIKDELMTKLRETTGHPVNQVVLGYLQRGGMPTMFDRVLAARMAVRAMDLIGSSQSGRAIGVRGGTLLDMSMDEALNSHSGFDSGLYGIAEMLSK